MSDSYGATTTSTSDAAGDAVTVRVTPWSASAGHSVSGCEPICLENHTLRAWWLCVLFETIGACSDWELSLAKDRAAGPP